MLDRAKGATRDVVSQIEEARRRRTAPLILELDLTEPLIEAPPQDPVNAFMARRRTSLRAVLDGLRRAATDPRVRALVVKVGGSRSPIGLAQAQELRDGVVEFRRSGKPAVAWAETFGEFGRGTVPYFLATGFDQIWLQPSGDVCLTGVAAEVPFIKGVLDKAGIRPQMAQRHEYKNAANLFTEEGFTAAHREATERLVTSTMEQLVGGIAAGRRLDIDEVLDLVDRAPLFSSEAVEAGLVDRLGYRDEVYDDVRSQVGERRRGRAGAAVHRPLRPVEAGGAEAPGDGVGRARRRRGPGPRAGPDPPREGAAASRSSAGQRRLRLGRRRPARRGEGRRRQGDRAPGDQPRRLLRGLRRHLARGGSRLEDTGKPVVVSMGDVAASGGYFVAMGADRIVAEPGTSPARSASWPASRWSTG